MDGPDVLTFVASCCLSAFSSCRESSERDPLPAAHTRIFHGIFARTLARTDRAILAGHGRSGRGPGGPNFSDGHRSCAELQIPPTACAAGRAPTLVRWSEPASCFIVKNSSKHARIICLTFIGGAKQRLWQGTRSSCVVEGCSSQRESTAGCYAISKARVFRVNFRMAVWHAFPRLCR